jgi:uncharacterized protein YdeI (YjbR/CyaY-like superfamily)
VDAVFFATPEELRAWLVVNHETAPELVVGYFKKGTRRQSITWPESVDQALCFGWIDGVRRGLDDERYCIRFTPRRVRSIWSAVNIRRFGELDAQGLVLPAGHLAFAARSEARSAIYAYEQDGDPVLWADAEQRFRANPIAWEYFCARPPSYRRTAIHRVVSAKKAETRERRLDELIRHSAEGQTIPQLRWTKS